MNFLGKLTRIRTYNSACAVVCERFDFFVVARAFSSIAPIPTWIGGEPGIIVKVGIMLFRWWVEIHDGFL